MEHTCSYCGARITPNQEKITIALFSKAVCSKNECTKRTQDEANKQTETLMTPRAKVLAFLARKGFEEQKGKPGFFILEGATKIAIDLNHQVAFHGIPVIGVLQTNGDIIEEGHGIQRIDDIRQEIEGILKSKGTGKSKKEIPVPNSQSQSTEEEKQKQPAGADAKNCVTEKTKTVKTKLGTPDTLTREVKDDTTRQTISKQENIINATAPGNQKTEVTGGQESPQPKVKVTIKTCSVCGLELSGARVLECFQKDIPFKCEECETKNRGDTKMDEKLPAINNNENKLTVDTIKQYICPTATDAEAYNFLQLCLHRDLNPFLKEAYLIKYGNSPATMVVGKDAFTRKAEESNKLDGFEAGIIVLNKEKQIERRIGVVQYEGDTLVGGWSKVFRKDMKYPFVCEVPLSEYIKYKDGKPQSSWAIMPGTMIRKVALVQSLREAFTKELGGCYDAVEMGAQDNIK